MTLTVHEPARMKRGSLAALLLATIAALPLGAVSASAHDEALVVTESGPVRGLLGDGYREFRAIPYAAPPVGELRWRSPAPAPRWTSPRDTHEHGSACPQEPAPVGVPSENEDCLHLTVTTPSDSSAHPLPVLVWIHGGGFRYGASSQFGAHELATHGRVVVVTLNYRLGVFGFMSHPALDGEGAVHSGNYGLEDQQAALRWVRRNAAAFGGDPSNVTVFGESSGSRSVCAQLVSPAARGLFDKAVMQSEPCTLGTWPQPDGRPDLEPRDPPRPRSLATSYGLTAAAALGCADPVTAARCLRAKSVAELLTGSAAYWFGPVYGAGELLPAEPGAAILAGDFTKLPVMHGITRDEYRLVDGFLESADLPPLDESGYVERVRAYVGASKADAVLARYPLQAGAVPSELWASVVTDSLYGPTMLELNHAFSRHVPTYAYEFADRDAPWYSTVPTPSFSTGAYHTAELPYLFEAEGFDPLSESQQKLSRQMIGYWARFAHTGSPNGPGLPLWLPAQWGRELVQQLDVGPGGVRRVNFARRHRVEFWQRLLAK